MLKSWLRRWLGVEQVFDAVVELQLAVQRLENDVADMDYRLDNIEVR